MGSTAQLPGCKTFHMTAPAIARSSQQQRTHAAQLPDSSTHREAAPTTWAQFCAVGKPTSAVTPFHCKAPTGSLSPVEGLTVW